jgi:conjugative relaxase-like TrwC/TraI family protein
MLSIKPFSSSDAASKYYSHGDYYGSEGEGTWLGLGAKDLGLNGDFTAKTDQKFNNLLKGILPNGQVLGRKTKDSIEHAPGTDLTFSAPKSFSIQMLLYSSPEQRTEMEHALRTAVSKTLQYIESQGYIFTRKGNGGYEKEKLEKLTFATFLHATNRNLEPQAHIHCFLANAAKCKDGKFRSITIDNLLENNKLFGQAFRNELALETKKLGHEITTTILSDGSSSFEIANIDPKLIEAFSTRRKEIVELCKLYGVTTKEGRDKIVINSRKAKKLVAKEELTKIWRTLENKVKIEIEHEQNAKELGSKNKTTQAPQTSSSISPFSSAISLFQDVKKRVSDFFKNQNKDSVNENEALTAESITKLAVEDVSYNKAVFTKEELLKKTLKYAIGATSVFEINQEVNKLEEKGNLIRHENQLTTKELLDKENQILKYAAHSIGKSKEMVVEKVFSHHYQKFEKRELAKNPDFQMNNGQRKAIKHILTSKDKIITMEGLPGVGKSTVLNAVRDIAGRKIISLIGFGENFEGSAPTASAAKTLRNSAKVESHTLHSFIARYQGYIEDRGTKESLGALKQEYKHTVIFVDEASLISTNIMHNLLKLQDKLGFRLVLTGDTKQLGSVEARKPFEQLLGVIKPVKLREVVRQKDEDHKTAVLEAAAGNIEKTFVIHDDAIKTTKVIAKEAANLYLGQSANQRDNTLLISPTRALRDQINNQMRNGLELRGEVLNLNILKPKDMGKADYNFAEHYNIGDVLRFNAKYTTGINRGDYLKVKAVHQVSNNLVLEKYKGIEIEGEARQGEKEILFHLKQNADYINKIEAFTQHNLGLQEGLKIIFTKNNKEHGLINSETAIIEKTGQNSITLKFEDRNSRVISTNQLKHIDYGYCVTGHNAQGKTYSNTIAAISNNKLLNNQKMWLVSISRHKNEFRALVEDKNLLKSYLMKNSGTELSAIELHNKVINDDTVSKDLRLSNNHGKSRDMKEIQHTI